MDKLDREEEKQCPFHGELLETILSFVPLLHLLCASHVCSEWRRAAHSFSRLSSFKPWLVVHIQSRRNPSSPICTRAYDPSSREWIKFTRADSSSAPAASTSHLRSSHSSLLYGLTPSELFLSINPLSDTWQSIDGPHMWRTDPIVARVGSHVVVAGGVCEFEDDPLAVEIYDTTRGRWDTGQSMPSALSSSASASWLSVAVSDDKMFLLEKQSGKFYSLHPKNKSWQGPYYLRPDPSIFFSVIGFSGAHLVLVGLVGDTANVESLRVWEVDCESLECREIGRMPLEMVRRLRDSSSAPPFVGIAMARGFLYIFDQWNPKDVFFCDFTSGFGNWGSVDNCDLVLNDRNRMNRLVLTCASVGLDDLRKAVGSGGRNFFVMKQLSSDGT